jgi:hypothetical protein
MKEVRQKNLNEFRGNTMGRADPRINVLLCACLLLLAVGVRAVADDAARS